MLANLEVSHSISGYDHIHIPEDESTSRHTHYHAKFSTTSIQNFHRSRHSSFMNKVYYSTWFIQLITVLSLGMYESIVSILVIQTHLWETIIDTLFERSQSSCWQIPISPTQHLYVDMKTHKNDQGYDHIIPLRWTPYFQDSDMLICITRYLPTWSVQPKAFFWWIYQVALSNLTHSDELSPIWLTQMRYLQLTIDRHELSKSDSSCLPKSILVGEFTQYPSSIWLPQEMSYY